MHGASGEPEVLKHLVQSHVYGEENDGEENRRLAVDLNL